MAAHCVSICVTNLSNFVPPREDCQRAACGGGVFDYGTGDGESDRTGGAVDTRVSGAAGRSVTRTQNIFSTIKCSYKNFILIYMLRTAHYIEVFITKTKQSIHN